MAKHMARHHSYSNVPREFHWYVTHRNYVNYNIIIYYCLGDVTRSCDSEGQWHEPQVLKCTTVEFINLEDRVC